MFASKHFSGNAFCRKLLVLEGASHKMADERIVVRKPFAMLHSGRLTVRCNKIEGVHKTVVGYIRNV